MVISIQFIVLLFSFLLSNEFIMFVDKHIIVISFSYTRRILWCINAMECMVFHDNWFKDSTNIIKDCLYLFMFTRDYAQFITVLIYFIT